LEQEVGPRGPTDRVHSGDAGAVFKECHGGNGNYAYRPAAPAVCDAAAAMSEVCRRWGTDLATAALQFSLRDPKITATVTGFTKQSTLVRTLDAAEVELPDAFWEELESLVPDPGHWLDNNDPIIW
jgi:D-threo-aldose 1-dehydrogenase